MSNTELHNMIGNALDEVTPPPAPVQAVIGRGRALRIRGRAGVAVCVAVVAAVAVAVPGLVRNIGVTRPVPHAKPPSVHVSRLGPVARRGVIAAGTINSVPWRVTLSRQGKQLCTSTSTQDLNCQPARGAGSTLGDPVVLNGSFNSRRYTLVGPVAARVSLIRVWLSDGVALRLYPVRFGGVRWVGVVLPARLRVRQAAAYSPTGEFAYAIPFQDTGQPTFVTWLRPGQEGHAKVTKMIASGLSHGRRWSAWVNLGPWGECTKTLLGRAVVSDACSALASVRHVGLTVLTGGSSQPAWLAGSAPAQIRQLRFWLSNQSSLRVAAVSVAGRRYFAFTIPEARTHVVRWSAYNTAGQRVAGGRGLPQG